MRRIDHKSVKYWPNKGWQLTATNAGDCRYTSSRLLLLSPSLSHPLHPPVSPDTCFCFSHTHTHIRFTTCKEHKALSFTADHYFLTHITIFCLYSALFCSFFFLSGFKRGVLSLEMGVCCVYVIVFVKGSVCICALENIPIISDLLANWKIPSILPSRHS